MSKYLVITNHLPAERFIVKAENYAGAEAHVLSQISSLIEVAKHIEILSIKKISENRGDLG